MIGDPEIWPDDDWQPPSRDELARDVLDPEEFRDYQQQTRRRGRTWA